VDEILSRLRAKIFPPGQVIRVTKHGELRIKGCMKYDLGSGYRLVTLKYGCHIYLLYAGSHDECNRWIENNRDLSLDLIQKRSKVVTIEPECCQKHQGLSRITFPNSVSAPVPKTDEPEKFYQDSELRQIFSGLTGLRD
jgi:hypothetical protein